jgi:MoaA/NifB/PqqE/SkfB family radical SAM enzyme
VDIEYAKDENERTALKAREMGSPKNPAFPVRMIFNTTYRCNLRCRMCFLSCQDTCLRARNAVLPFPIFNSLCDETLPLAKEIKLTVSGEPLLTPYFDEVPAILRKHHVWLNLTTNGTLLTREKSRRIMPVLSDVKVSLDGASRKTYEYIRVGAKFDTVLENVEGFLEERAAFMGENPSAHRPTMTIQVVLMRENIKELPELVELAHELGVDRVKAYHMLVFDPVLKSSALLYDAESRSMSNDFIREAAHRAHSYGIETKFPKHFTESCQESPRHRGTRTCHFLWQEGWIDVNGNVVSCCTPGRPVLGNVFRNSFLEIWNNQAYQDMRRRLNSSSPYECCRKCAIVNEFLDDNFWNYEENSFYVWDETYARIPT